MSYYKIRLIPCCICEADHNKRTQLSSAAWSPPGDDAAGLEAATALAAVTFMIPPVCHASPSLPLPTARRPRTWARFPPAAPAASMETPSASAARSLFAMDAVVGGGVGRAFQPRPSRRRRPAGAIRVGGSTARRPGRPGWLQPAAPARPGWCQRAAGRGRSPPSASGGIIAAPMAVPEPCSPQLQRRLARAAGPGMHPHQDCEQHAREKMATGRASPRVSARPTSGRDRLTGLASRGRLPELAG